jgi:hypothetical protein
MSGSGVSGPGIHWNFVTQAPGATKSDEKLRVKTVKKEQYIHFRMFGFIANCWI